MQWGSPVEIETRKRIRLAVAAYAYEIKADPIMSDSDFDNLANEIEPDVDTYNPELDDFFAHDFRPHTGAWVHKHPDLAGLERIYNMLRSTH